MNKVAWTSGLGVAAVVAIAIAPRLMALDLADAAPTIAPPPPLQAVVAEVEAPPVQVQDEPQQSALVEVVFVLDTTGSMGGLLDGAKDTVWSILDTFVSQTPRPEIRVGIVAYRDRGDLYVTRDLPLTSDLDAAHAFLKSLNADGGGDHAESVGHALWVATDSMEWTRQRDKTYRTIFLVGDAPGKAYTDEASPEGVVRIAKERGIYVNAVQCGTDGMAAGQWRRVASLGDGEFVQVAQDGGRVAAATPYDEELAGLDADMAATALPYGAGKASVEASIAASGGLGSSTRASRRSTLSKLGAGTSSRDGDLVEALEDGRLGPDTITEADLPDAWKGLTPAEREADADERVQRRQQLKRQIDATIAERDAWIVAEGETSGEVSFDSEVKAKTVEQLKELGLVE